MPRDQGDGPDIEGGQGPKKMVLQVRLRLQPRLCIVLPHIDRADGGEHIVEVLGHRNVLFPGQPTVGLGDVTGPVQADPGGGDICPVLDGEVQAVQTVGRHPYFWIRLLERPGPDIIVPHPIILTVKVKRPLG